MPGLETMILRAGRVRADKMISVPILEHNNWAEKSNNVNILCPCCRTFRQDAPSVLPVPINNTPTRLYSPLYAKKQEFRLLTLCSGSFEDEVCCNLVPVDMHSNPSYAVLSYFRGAHDDRGNIRINGQIVSVTRSLEVALKYFRKSKGHRVLWVAAICINQDDIDERSSQVSLIRDIYAKASTVSVWLGESAKNSDLAMEAIETVYDQNIDDMDRLADPAVWTAIRTLFQRPYWRRLWTVPEVLLAREAIVMCGWKQVPIECFVRLQQIISMYSGTSESRLKYIYVGEMPYTIILDEWYNLRKLISHDGIRISQLLTITGRFETCFPVDKIFAVLSISTEVDREVLKIDYRLCIRCLLTRIAKYNFIRSEACSPLTFLQTHQVNKNPSLPSWVPDYSKYDNELHLLVSEVEGATHYAAAATNADWNKIGAKRLTGMDDSHNSAKLQLDGRAKTETLVLTGICVGVVKKAMAAPFTDLYTGTNTEEDARVKRERKEDTLNTCKEWEKEVHSTNTAHDPYKKTCGRAEAFWRTVIGDRDLTWKGPPTPDWEFGQRFEAWMGRGDKADDEIFTRPYSHPAIIRTIYRSFLVTENGYLGLGRSDTKAGNLVVLLRGGDVPFILRREDDEGCYTFIGEAYVHGIMDGSFVRDATGEDITSFNVR